MFNSYERAYREAQEEISTLKDTIKSLEKIAKEVHKDHVREIERITSKHGDDMARLTANIDTKITEKTNELTKQVSKLESENKISLEKVSMYEKAFENLGFDVKDMKEILNKLVDGLVAKNQIHLIGSNNK